MKISTGFATGSATTERTISFSLKSAPPVLQECLRKEWGEDIFRSIPVELPPVLFQMAGFPSGEDFFSKHDNEFTAQIAYTLARMDVSHTPIPKKISFLQACVAIMLLIGFPSYYGAQALEKVHLATENIGAYIFPLLHQPITEGMRKGLTKTEAFTYEHPDKQAFSVREFSKGSRLWSRGEKDGFYEVVVTYDLNGKPEKWAWIKIDDCVLVMVPLESTSQEDGITTF